MYAATILADSISPHGIRLTTVEATYPRSYHSEFMTHRMLSRNSESSRAIPTEVLFDRVKNNPYIPVMHERVKGMGVGEPLKGRQRTNAHGKWLKLRDEALRFAESMLHVSKDEVNRALEPFLWHTAIYTATDWDNFFNLRCHPDAALPIRKAAETIRDAMWESSPAQLQYGEWHLPMVTDFEYALGNLRQPGLYGAKVSAGRCARSSYSTHHNPESMNESADRWDTLSAKGHWSPGEHPAMAVEDFGYIGNFRGWMQLRKHYENEAVFVNA